MIAAEVAGTHAYANVTVKGYVKQRTREWRQTAGIAPTATGKANVAGWQQLTASFEQMGMAVQHGGEQLVSHA